MLAYEAPGFGVGELWLDDGLLVWHELPHPRALPDAYAGGAGRTPPTATSVTRKSARVVHREGRERAESLAERLRGFFRGEPNGFADVDVDLDWATPFQRAVTNALRRVPRGEVVTYGELAALSGYPNAQRAVGSYCAGNRYGVIVPCHRVISATGLGGYGSLGPGYKQRLLSLEGVALP
jgi:methylated-DNA-[protein]-cysteine S-methyltransferase